MTSVDRYRVRRACTARLPMRFAAVAGAATDLAYRNAASARSALAGMRPSATCRPRGFRRRVRVGQAKRSASAASARGRWHGRSFHGAACTASSAIRRNKRRLTSGSLRQTASPCDRARSGRIAWPPAIRADMRRPARATSARIRGAIAQSKSCECCRSLDPLRPSRAVIARTEPAASIDGALSIEDAAARSSSGTR